jgi:hypothetical protein
LLPVWSLDGEVNYCRVVPPSMTWPCTSDCQLSLEIANGKLRARDDFRLRGKSWVMYVKCIYDLCSYLGHNLFYFLFLKELDMFSINFRHFLNNVFSFDFNIAKQIFMFFHDFDF